MSACQSKWSLRTLVLALAFFGQAEAAPRLLAEDACQKVAVAFDRATVAPQLEEIIKEMPETAYLRDALNLYETFAADPGFVAMLPHGSATKVLSDPEMLLFSRNLKTILDGVNTRQTMGRAEALRASVAEFLHDKVPERTIAARV